MKDIKFIDQVTLFLKAGRGGEGCSARRRFRSHFMNIGGDGGQGGSVYIEADSNIFDLSKFRNRSRLSAKDGHYGLAHNKRGRGGEDLVLKTPVGTRVLDKEGNLLFDLAKHGQRVLVAQGGRGGKGNFKRKATTSPEKGQEKEVILDLQVPSDVVLLGYTNSGKSTLLSQLTQLKPKISEFPFTTINPLWGVVQKDYKAFTILELPAIIGKKTQEPPGWKFLKYIARARVIVFLLDPQNPDEQYQALSQIIAEKGPDISDKYTLRVLNKTDKINQKVPAQYMAISAKENRGLDNFIDTIFKLLAR